MKIPDQQCNHVMVKVSEFKFFNHDDVSCKHERFYLTMHSAAAI